MYKRKPHTKETKFKMSLAHKGKIVSEDTRNKLREINTGKKYSKEVNSKKGLKGSKNGFYGKQHTEEVMARIKKARKNQIFSLETREKKRESMRGKNKGQKHWNWKGGVTPEIIKIRSSIEMKLWKNAVLARDNWTDQKTGVKGGNIVVHHILNFSSYPELRTSIENGITLSKEAHLEFHKIYGKKNNTRQQLEEYLGRKL